LYLSSVSEKIEKGKTNDVVLKPETFGYLKVILDNSLGGDSVMLETYMVGPEETFQVMYYPWSAIPDNYSKVRSGFRHYQIKQYNNNNETIVFDTLFVERYQEHELEINF
jgi:hypothetical protein